MTKTSINTMLALGAVCLMGGVMQAQEYRINAKVPFAFEVQSKVLPAGDYTFVNAPAKTSVEVLNRKTGEHRYILVGMTSQTTDGRTCILFNRYGNTYFLSEVRTANAGARAVRISQHEKELIQSARAGEPVTTASIKGAE